MYPPDLFSSDEYPFKPPVTFEILNKQVSHYCFLANVKEAQRHHKTFLPQSMSRLFRDEWSPALTINRLLQQFLQTFDSSLVKIADDDYCDYRPAELVRDFRDELARKQIRHDDEFSFKNSFENLNSCVVAAMCRSRKRFSRLSCRARRYAQRTHR
jgi:ubiquitin-protein ligase